MQWVVKASKLCNLRCKYCYEWDYLSNPERMPEEVWRRTLIAVRDYAELATRDSNWPVTTDIIWHGGEPLLLPLPYLRTVMALEKESFPPGWIEQGRITNCVQTNLYSVDNALIAFLQEYKFNIGVSVDFIRGVRLTAAGRETESRVLKNIDRLDAAGLPYALILVLARHTTSNVDRVFEQIARVGRPTRLLGLFSGPTSRPMEGVDISHGEMLKAMFHLFKLWFKAGMSPRIDPFDECVKTVVMKRMNLRRKRYDRAILGSEVFQIDLDGRLTCTSFGASRPLGNVLEMSVADLLKDKRYLDLVRDEESLKDAICTQCSFLGACDTKPIARWFDRATLADCPIERYLCPMIEDYFEEKGLLSTDFDVSANEVVSEYAEFTMH